jgi:hypothetical protein
MNDSIVRSLPDIEADTSDIDSHGDDLIHKYCPHCNPSESLVPGALVTRMCGSRGLVGVGHDGKASPYGPQCHDCMAACAQGGSCPACGYSPW